MSPPAVSLSSASILLLAGALALAGCAAGPRFKDQPIVWRADDARSIPEENYRLDRFMTGKEELLEASKDLRIDGDEGIRELDSSVKESIEEVLEQLSPREREVIERRFGLGGGPGPQTLAQVGRRFGVTKERVRQIEGKALDKLRHMLDRETLEATVGDK